MLDLSADARDELLQQLSAMIGQAAVLAGGLGLGDAAATLLAVSTDIADADPEA